MTKKLMIAAGVAAMSLAASACNTVRGAAEDVESVANEVDEEI